jgi:hypothetical protein
MTKETQGIPQGNAYSPEEQPREKFSVKEFLGKLIKAHDDWENSSDFSDEVYALIAAHFRDLYAYIKDKTPFPVAPQAEKKDGTLHTQTFDVKVSPDVEIKVMMSSYAEDAHIPVEVMDQFKEHIKNSELKSSLELSLDKLKKSDANREMFVKTYDAGQRDFAGIDLSYSNLSGLEIDGVDMTGAKFTGANLYGIIVTNSTFVGATFEGANLYCFCARDSDFSNTKMLGANLRKAHFYDTKLEGSVPYRFYEKDGESFVVEQDYAYVKATYSHKEEEKIKLEQDTLEWKRKLKTINQV